MARKKVGASGACDFSDSEILWGINPVREALLADAVRELAVVRGKGGPRIQQLIDIARKKGVRLRFVPPERLGVPARTPHQGVVARRAHTRLVPLDRLLQDFPASRTDTASLLVLDSIQDPRNLGSILRSALAAGFRHVIVTGERSAPLSGVVAKTSAGALDHLRVAVVINLRSSLEHLKEHGFWVYGAVTDRAATSIYETDFSGRVALVLGSENRGLRPLVRRSCDTLVTIPMYSEFDSLNVSVAAGIMMFEIARAQRSCGRNPEHC